MMTQMDGSRGNSALTTLVVTAEVQQGFDSALDGLIRHGATAAAIVERSGMTLSAAGMGRTSNPAVGALIGGVFKSLKTLSGLLGENAIRTLHQKGPHSLTVMLLLDTDDLLVATFPPEVGDGRCDELANEAGTRIATLLAQARQNPAPQGALLDEAGVDDLLGNF
jgi:predicted regulator of Ras-like GTPase activity (Roadblock/LC7/MglB family)